MGHRQSTDHVTACKRYDHSFHSKFVFDSYPYLVLPSFTEFYRVLVWFSWLNLVETEKTGDLDGVYLANDGETRFECNGHAECAVFHETISRHFQFNLHSRWKRLSRRPLILGS